MILNLGVKILWNLAKEIETRYETRFLLILFSITSCFCNNCMRANLSFINYSWSYWGNQESYGQSYEYGMLKDELKPWYDQQHCSKWILEDAIWNTCLKKTSCDNLLVYFFIFIFEAVSVWHKQKLRPVAELDEKTFGPKFWLNQLNLVRAR